MQTNELHSYLSVMKNGNLKKILSTIFNSTKKTNRKGGFGEGMRMAGQ